jgi:hypothetical protein
MLAVHPVATHVASPSALILFVLAIVLVALWRPALRIVLAIALVTLVLLLVSGAEVILNYAHQLR